MNWKQKRLNLRLGKWPWTPTDTKYRRVGRMTAKAKGKVVTIGFWSPRQKNSRLPVAKQPRWNTHKEVRQALKDLKRHDNK